MLDTVALDNDGLAEIKAAFRIALQRLDLHLEVAVDIVLRAEGQVRQNGVLCDLALGGVAEEELALSGLEARELRRAHTGDIVHQGRIPGDLKQAVRRGLVGRQGQVYIAVGGHGAALHGSDALRGRSCGIRNRVEAAGGFLCAALDLLCGHGLRGELDIVLLRSGLRSLDALDAGIAVDTVDRRGQTESPTLPTSVASKYRPSELCMRLSI